MSPWKTLKHRMFFWTFVLLAAYLVYIYPIQRLTDWLNYPALLNLPTIFGLWLLVIAVLRLSFRSSSRKLELILYNWMGIGFVFFCLCFIYELLRLGLALDDYWAGVGILIVGVCITIYAMATAQRLFCKRL